MRNVITALRVSLMERLAAGVSQRHLGMLAKMRYKSLK